MPDGTYAPQSPDLSSFLSSSPQKKPPPTSSYTPKSPNLPAFLQQAHSYAPLKPEPLPQQKPSYQPHREYVQYGAPPPFQQTSSASTYLAPIPDLPGTHPFAVQQEPSLQDPYSQQLFQPHQFQPGLPADTAPPDMSGRGKRSAAAMNMKSENGADSAMGPSALGPSQGIDIKTKFPVARIKRIMQADEEVGKVAQVTPVAVSKALELFMISLVTRSAALARTAHSKRVTAQHLKRVIDADEQFDFLAEISGRVAEGPDAGAGSSGTKRVKSEDRGSEDEEMGGAGPGTGGGGRGGANKRGKGGRRKRGE